MPREIDFFLSLASTYTYLAVNRAEAVVASLEGWCPEYAKETYRDWFLENRIPGDPANVREILSRLGNTQGGSDGVPERNRQ